MREDGKRGGEQGGTQGERKLPYSVSYRNAVKKAKSAYLCSSGNADDDRDDDVNKV